MFKYNLILYILSPYLILKLISSTILRKSGLKYFIQRLGYNQERYIKKTIWIHAASIGETKIALTLYEEFYKKNKNTTFIITTNTSSSRLLINETENLRHHYLPIDWLFSMKRFIKNINPKICIIIETEIWPNLISICKKNHIPTTIINARLSKKTTGSSKYVKGIYQKTLRKINKIMCKSDIEKKKYIDLGANEIDVKTIGNLKFNQYKPLLKNTNLINRKYVLALSTHADEERQIISEWLKVNDKRVLLVIIPRHPERLGDILSDLPLSMVNLAIRSKGEKIKNSTQIYIADTLGEVENLLEYCEFVFVGGSLVDHGGQNFLEAASHGKTIIVGPYMYNFISETEEFLKKNSMIMVKNSNTLKHVFERLLKSKQRRELFGNNAKKIMESKKDIVTDYCRLIQELIVEK